MKKIIIAADFETIPINGVHYVYAWSFTSINQYEPSTYITNKIKNQDEIITRLIEKIKATYFNKKNKIIIYFHNLGNFDGLFILKNLKNYHKEKISTLIRHNSIYEIKINNLTFRDSAKLLPDSLLNLSKAFKINTKTKEDFNHNEINLENINTNIKKIEKYINYDVNSLLEIITKFRELVIEEEGIDPTKHTTLSSLAYTIWKTNYIKNHKIVNTNKLPNKWKSLLKNSYRGGVTEVLKPVIKPKDSAKYYDINSSYPNCMMKYEMPIGYPKEIPLNTDEIPNFFGFIKCRIQVNNKYMPTIGIKCDKRNSTIYPIGEFNIEIFSEELKMAIKNDNIKIKKIFYALQFEKKKIFKEIIEKFYNKRIETKSEAKKKIYKLLMNSLYGRFALKEELDKSIIINNDDLKIYESIFSTHVIADLKSKKIISIKTSNIDINKILKTFIISDESKKEIKKIHNNLIKNNKNSEASISIAAATTSYARMELFKLINKALINKKKVWYADSDSIITNYEFKSECGENIGQIKKECEIKKAYFLAPKLYIIQKTNNENIIKFKGLNNISKEINFNDNPIEIFKEMYQNSNKTNPIQIILTNYRPILKQFNKMSLLNIKRELKPTLILKKREKIYNNKGEWVDTKPLIIKNGDD